MTSTEFRLTTIFGNSENHFRTGLILSNLCHPSHGLDRFVGVQPSTCSSSTELGPLASSLRLPFSHAWSIA
uniref:Uncharacterized protein n=1 Tax=Oryza sativa subsp. japonica TaxID=39947 RepID=Q6Z9Y6_ORYSJ|nr:hypothetical protein [Oryza sativa Japonica Group]BAD05457.1 hypothetical protein [Oryza sativa Japonica Group]